MDKKIGDRKYYCYSGVVHIHTTASDGTLGIEEIIPIGEEVGLDFMMFADHMTLEHRENGFEGRRGRTLVIIGYEHNDAADKNHYLLFGAPRVYPDSFTARQYVAAAAADGVLGIVAHPDENRSRMGKYPPYPWTEWKLDGFQGMEMWNQMSEWMEKLKPWNKLAQAFSPRKSMVGPTERMLKIWDEINMKRKCVGLASVDAHAFPIRVGPLKVRIFPYKVHFKSLRTHIVMSQPVAEDFEKARDQLFNAIRESRVFFSNMRWGMADDFEFYAVNKSGQAVSGESLQLDDDTRLRVKLPQRATLKVIGNGQRVLSTVTDELEYKVAGSGIYRVEAWKKKRGWIFSNHIRIGV
jgi:hypothetical protein